jgi:hypothetical protein
MIERIRAVRSECEMSSDLDLPIGSRPSRVWRALYFSVKQSEQSSTTVRGVIREIEICRVAVLMVNRYADEAEANSFRRAEERAAEGDHAGAVSGVGSLSRSSNLPTRGGH